MAVVTNVPIEQTYFVADITSTLLYYNRMRWYRSRSGSSGNFEAMTAATAQPASLRCKAGPYLADDKEFGLSINGTEVTLTFSGTDAMTAAELATALNAESAALDCSDDDGTLVISTVATGIAASLEVLSTDAAPYLGLTVGAGAIGQDADLTLTSGTAVYNITDDHGDSDWWYSIEYLHATSGATSVRSAAFPSRRLGALPLAQTIVGYVRLVDPSGAPVPQCLVSIHNVFMPNSVTSGAKTWGVFRNYVTATTDADGYASLPLVRGATVDVNIAGTGFTRRIEVPSTGDSFDLLDGDLSTTDEFGIAVPDIAFAVRTS